MRPNRKSALLFAMLALASCRAQSGEDAYNRYAGGLLGRPFPADGRIHFEHRGQFVLTPATIICTWRPGMSLYPDVALAAVRAVDPDDFVNRAQGSFGATRAQTSPGCDPARPGGDRIFVHGGERAGYPGYRVWIAIWQGDALWVGGIERPDGLRPDAEVRPGAIPVNDGLESLCIWCEDKTRRALREDSRRLDGYSLSRYFFARFVKVQR